MRTASIWRNTLLLYIPLMCIIIVYRISHIQMPCILKKNSFNEELIGGWMGEAEDGADDAVITHKELESGSAFREWLEEVVEQSSLNSECHRIVDEAGVGYVMRDPALPLPQYLSFLKVFCAAAGVRGILEGKAGKTRTVTPEDAGLVICCRYRV
ncbi:hypothetical protein C4B63_216g18 [Trypanosoma cruzi]|uniref:Uncharacterized protein n=1 Tax=Trypanosoma cruzi TaxID=5693 RepID=A0A2V2UQL3_TRYCR|nr:hypothetical protein C4B63_216g18 [Trypanosoma cruzi]